MSSEDAYNRQPIPPIYNQHKPKQQDVQARAVLARLQHVIEIFQHMNNVLML